MLGIGLEHGGAVFVRRGIEKKIPNGGKNAIRNEKGQL